MNESQVGTSSRGGVGKVITAIIVLAVIVAIAYVVSMKPEPKETAPVNVGGNTPAAPTSTAPAVVSDTTTTIQGSLDSINVGDLNADLKGINDSLKNL